jgi:hypothetical protein
LIYQSNSKSHGKIYIYNYGKIINHKQNDVDGVSHFGEC